MRPGRFGNFMLPRQAESVPGTVVINGNEMCRVSYNRSKICESLN